MFVTSLVMAAPAFAATTIGLASTPLYGRKVAHPNVVVALSVEFPTVGAAHNGVTYDRTVGFVGYFDPKQCYVYTGASSRTTGYFVPSVAADANHECPAGTSFSGSFMNWVSMSAIDEFRYALTGGNRVVDTATQTVLERAFLYGSFYNSGNFPRRTLDGGFPSAANRVTPFSGTVYVTSCDNLIFFGTGTSGSCSDAVGADTANNQGTYLVRVQVCDLAEGPVRKELCQAYGANYKPVGQVQKNVDQMRFAAFGYLMDNTRTRYGGVLRAPMNYTGQYKYDAFLNRSANTDQEIDPTTGIFTANPLGAAEGISGFINYINKFGSTGTYKTYDPASELYYEALRYYQNLGPTAQAVAGVTAAMKDNFPYYTDWGPGYANDPILSSCQDNFIINVSDANTWDDASLPGNPGTGFGGLDFARPVEGGLDIIQWTKKVGDLEVLHGHPELAGLESKPTGVGNASYFIAGAAFFAHTQDIRLDLPGTQTVKTFSFDVAEASIALADRQLYLAGKYGGFDDKNGDGNPFVTFDGTGATVTNDSEWEDGPGSGYPSNYLLASDPVKLINGLNKAFTSISKSTGTISGIALNSSSFVYGSGGAFSVAYNPFKWSGSISYYTLTYDKVGKKLVPSTTAVWDAADQLDAFIGTVATTVPAQVALRKIYTMSTVSTNTPIAFDWTSINADATYKAYLDANPVTGTADGLAQKRLNYLRGDRVSDESPAGAGFRARSSAFGDIINSAPVYVAAPSTGISDPTYSAFYAAHKNRTKTVYAGANDGMLHAIDATNGNEIFTYVPRAIASKLNKLTDPAYVHQGYVDAVPVVSEAKLSGAWKSVLVSGLGTGAQGVFALDVTDPASFGTGNVMWEFTDADDPDMGNIISKPLIVKINTTVSPALPVYQWYAIFTGYNSMQVEATPATVSSDAQGTIFILRLDKPTSSAWLLGSNYYKIKTPVTDSTIPNGLSSVAARVSQSGAGDAVYLYTGDLQGNLWKIDLTQGSSTWNGNTPVMFSANPFFVAKDGAGNRQPITAKPTLGTGPLPNTTMVYVGTGIYLGAADLSNYNQQSFYSLFDDGFAASGAISGRSALRARVLTKDPVTGKVSIAGTTFPYSSGSSPLAGSSKGWYLDYFETSPTPTFGERSISSAVLSGSTINFVTLTLASSSCGSGGGLIYKLNALNGSGRATVSTVGIPGPPQAVTFSESSSKKNSTRGKVVGSTDSIVISGSSGGIQGGDVDATDPPTRKLKDQVGWREIPNWNTLSGH